MTHAMITGCSHTAGVGVDPHECYVTLVEQHYGFAIKNQGVPGGSCVDVLEKIANEINSGDLPKFIVAQWPNVFRKPCWINGKRHKQNIHACDESFKLLLKNDEKNFYEPWVSSILIANLLCRLVQVPIINIFLDSQDVIKQEYIDTLMAKNIIIHLDEKLPGRTWFFDSLGNDDIHHSAWCHEQWTKRLIGIINETSK